MFIRLFHHDRPNDVLVVETTCYETEWVKEGDSGSFILRAYGDPRSPATASFVIASERNAEGDNFQRAFVTNERGDTIDKIGPLFRPDGAGP